jgi:2-hydroxychromene-2-carboxylate isomerase
MLTACHGRGEAPSADAEYAWLAREAGLDPGALLRALAAPQTAAAYAANVARARAAGAFGVPTFITADGALFFGQDRLPLLRDHLAASQA